MDLADGVRRDRQAEQEADDAPAAIAVAPLRHEHAIASPQIELIERIPRPQRLPQLLATGDKLAAPLHSYRQRLLGRGDVETGTHHLPLNEEADEWPHLDGRTSRNRARWSCSRSRSSER